MVANMVTVLNEIRLTFVEDSWSSKHDTNKFRLLNYVYLVLPKVSQFKADRFEEHCTPSKIIVFSGN